MLVKAIKKSSRQLLLLLLTIGASLTLGLLSYAGMFVLWPIMALGIAAFILAVAYESEIFWQNLKGAFKTLFSTLALKKQFLREFLAKYVPESEEERKKLPAILQSYLDLIQEQDKLEHLKQHNELSYEELLTFKTLKQKIKRYELELAEQLFNLQTDPEHNHKDLQELRGWLKNNNGCDYVNKHRVRYALFTAGKALSIVAGSFVTIGTGYLLFEAFMTLSFLAMVPAAALPTVILTLAILSGIAYALITYNSITAMLNNRSLPKLWNSLIKDYKEGSQASLTKKILKGISVFIFLSLTLILTICTAGTWWTIGQNLAFLISQGWIIAATAVLSASTIVINLFNTICTWFGIKKEIKHYVNGAEEKTADSSEETSSSLIFSIFKVASNRFKKSFEPINANDSLLQRFNPFRIFIKILLTPIEWFLFLAHIISIGVAGDQIPGIHQYVSTALCAIDEGKEDWHRFFGHSHFHGTKTLKPLLKARAETGGGHEHNLDLPKRFIQFLLSPLYILATLVDFGCMIYKNKTQTSAAPTNYTALLKSAILRQFTDQEPHYHTHSSIHFAKPPLAALKFEAIILIRALEKRLEGTMVRGKNVATQKLQALKNIGAQIASCEDVDTLKNILKTAHTKNEIKAKRYSFFPTNPNAITTTEQELQKAYQLVFC